MREEYIGDLVSGLVEGGIGLCSGVPDSWLRNVHEAVDKNPNIIYVPVGNEGVGFSICTGAWLGGKKGVLLTENSGLRVACEYIARYSMGCNIPVLIITSYRGDIGDTKYWSVPHGIVMEPLLKALRIPYVVISEPDKLKNSIVKAIKLSDVSQYPVAVIIGGDLVWQ